MDRRSLLGLRQPAASKTPVVKTGGGGGGAPQAAYVRYPVMTASVRRPDGRRGVLSVETGVDAPPELAQRAQQSQPRIRAGFNVVIQRVAAEALPGRPPDVQRLSRELQAALDAALGRRGARVLLGTVMSV